MEITELRKNNSRIAQVQSAAVLINTAEDALDLLGNLYYQGFDGIILHQENITPDFFDLRNGIAGEILQKFSTYRMKLAIVGDFENLASKSLKDFIFESNKQQQINFVATTEAAMDKLSIH
jgi:hypothetical protein